jgi:hypothetical protein
VAGVSRQSLEFLAAAGVTEDDLVARLREDRPQLPAHQTRSQNSDSHTTLLVVDLY